MSKQKAVKEVYLLFYELFLVSLRSYKELAARLRARWPLPKLCFFYQSQTLLVINKL